VLLCLQMFSGHIGTAELAAVALSNTVSLQRVISCTCTYCHDSPMYVRLLHCSGTQQHGEPATRY
jgi:hypothetical protein